MLKADPLFFFFKVLLNIHKTALPCEAHN